MTPAQLVTKLNDAIINPLLLLLWMGALIVFVWGIVQFMQGLSSGSENKEKGKQHMLWGIIGMVIMASAYAIINVALNSIGCDLSQIGNCR